VSFFFQAEDGIRDPLVTGVQTCALPICQILIDIAAAVAHMHPATSAWGWADDLDRVAPDQAFGGTGPTPGATAPIRHAQDHLLRSEERRVGKECRAWWGVE